MPKKPKTREIQEVITEKNGNLSPDVFQHLCVNSFEGVANNLVDNWDGKPIGIIGIELEEDNGKVANTMFMVQGHLSSEELKSWDLDSWWPKEDKVNLTLLSLDCGKFYFESGLTSDLLDWKEVDFEIRCSGIYWIVTHIISKGRK